MSKLKVILEKTSEIIFKRKCVFNIKCKNHYISDKSVLTDA